MKQRPLVQAACFWIAGSTAACLLQGTEFWLLWAGMVLLLPLYGLLCSLSWRKLVILAVIFTAAAGYWMTTDKLNTSKLSNSYEQISQSPLPDKTTAAIRGILVTPAEIDGDRVTFTLRLKGEAELDLGLGHTDDNLLSAKKKLTNVDGERVLVQVTLAKEAELDEASLWARGQELRVTGALERPGISSNYGGFDYRNYLYHQRVHWLLKVKGASQVALVNTAGGWGAPQLLGSIDQLRQALGAKVDALFPDWQGGYMKGLLIGLADELEPDKYTQFTNLGLSHILAISGSHVAINIGLLLGLCRLCRLTKETSQLFALGFTPFYVLLTGFTPSVIRAGIMTMLGLYLLRRGLLKDGLHLVAASCLVMLIWDPYLLVNVSFQLSFAVTAGLIVFVPLLMPWLKWLPGRFRSAAAITVAAQLVSFPLTIFYFNQVSLLSLAANLVLVPLVSLVSLPGGTAALLVGHIWMPLARLMAYPVTQLNRLTFIITEWLNSWAGSMTYWKSPSLLWMLSFYVVLYWLLSREAGLAKEGERNRGSLQMQEDTAPLPPYPGYDPRSASVSATISFFNEPRRSWRDIGMSLAAAAMLGMLLYTGYQSDYRPGTGYVEFLDVGQGDSALITTPAGLHILVDGGGTVTFRKAGDAWRQRRDPFEVGKKTLVPLLKKRGIHRLDAVVLTHGDQDHIGGLQAVLDSFPVGMMFLNGSLADSATMNQLMRTALEQDIPIYGVKTGQVLQPDRKTRLVFLAPEDELITSNFPYSKDQNTRSIVFRLTMDGISFLFTGDMDAKAERRILKQVESQAIKGLPLQSDILKVAHHGSKTSSTQEWLSQVQPGISIISAGRSNVYGHPDSGVVERLEAAGSRIYRIDLNGGIQFRILHGELYVRSKWQALNEAY